MRRWAFAELLCKGTCSAPFVAKFQSQSCHSKNTKKEHHIVELKILLTEINT